jgi:ligand-binding sensor domain-containing protein
MALLLAAALALAPLQETETISRLFAATPEGPYISYSWGEHWSRLRADTRGFEGTLEAFACLGPWVFAGGPKGLFVSEDFGENYRKVSGWPDAGPAVTRLLAARLFALEPTLFVGTTDGLYRSTGLDSEWLRMGDTVIEGAVRDITWPGPELFVATDAGLFRTRDKGERFERVGAGLPDAPLLAIVVSRFFAIEPVVFVGTGGAGLFKSVDGGETFEAVGADLLGKGTVRALVWWGGLLIAGTDGGLFLSDDAGKKFRKARDLEGRRVLSISVPGAEEDVASDVIVGTEGGVLKSSDGAQRFRRVQEGMGSLEVRALATFPLPPQNRERRSR